MLAVLVICVGVLSCRARDGGIRRAVTRYFRVEGMTCASCARTIAKTLRRIPGVVQAEVRFASRLATVRFQSDRVQTLLLTRAIAAIGYKLKAASPPQGGTGRSKSHE